MQRAAARLESATRGRAASQPPSHSPSRSGAAPAKHGGGVSRTGSRRRRVARGGGAALEPLHRVDGGEGVLPLRAAEPEGCDRDAAEGVDVDVAHQRPLRGGGARARFSRPGPAALGEGPVRGRACGGETDRQTGRERRTELCATVPRPSYRTRTRQPRVRARARARAGWIAAPSAARAGLPTSLPRRARGAAARAASAPSGREASRRARRGRRGRTGPGP